MSLEILKMFSNLFTKTPCISCGPSPILSVRNCMSHHETSIQMLYHSGILFVLIEHLFITLNRILYILLYCLTLKSDVLSCSYMQVFPDHSERDVVGMRVKKMGCYCLGLMDSAPHLPEGQVTFLQK